MTIEIKNADDRLEEAFEIFDELMKKYNMQDKVVWGIWA